MLQSSFIMFLIVYTVTFVLDSVCLLLEHGIFLYLYHLVLLKCTRIGGLLLRHPTIQNYLYSKDEQLQRTVIMASSTKSF